MSGPKPRRAALVTGGSNGIGRAIALELAGAGYDLTLVARGADRLEEVSGEVEHLAKVVTVASDLRPPDAPGHAVAAHRRAHGRLDVLVNCAGVGQPQPVAQLTDNRLDLHVDMNLRLPMNMCRESADLLFRAGAEHGNARVVNVASVVGKHGVRCFAAYSATKAALVSFTQVLNDEWGRHGVLATAVCPGLVETPMSAAARPAEGPDSIRPEDVGRLVVAIVGLSPACAVPELTMTAPGGDPLAGIRSSMTNRRR